MTVVRAASQATSDRASSTPEALSRSHIGWLVAAAIALRLFVFAGRGDYVAFDEGWYLLLGRNLMSGNGFTLSGLQHVVLSPLFPVLAGTLDLVLGNIVWSGRIVAAVAGGLLVLPCWWVFVRLGDQRTAAIACLLIAVIPTLAPFAAAYWVGWDLWVGAEPILHLFLFAALAATLRALDRRTRTDWVWAGVAFGLAYLSRPEAVIVLALATSMVAVVAMWRRDCRQVVRMLILMLAFSAVAAPYWLYLHDSLGRWTITGRAVEVRAPRFVASNGETANRRAPAMIEGMLWGNDNKSYRQTLYGLDPTATRLSSGYWGLQSRDPAAPAALPVPVRMEDSTANADWAVDADRVSTSPAPLPGDVPPRVVLYGRALATAVPWILWPLMLIGLVGRRRNWSAELIVVAPVAIASAIIAWIVAADPRTQLLVVPVAAYYAARGIQAFGATVDRMLPRGTLRQGFPASALAVVIVIAFLATEVRWVYLGTTIGSPHHLVGAANRRTGEALREIVPTTEPVMSWHPAIALYARRDWRVLPDASFADMVRYANAIRSEYVVLSVYYQSPIEAEQMPREYLLVRVPPGSAELGSEMHVSVDGGDGALAVGRVTRLER